MRRTASGRGPGARNIPRETRRRTRKMRSDAVIPMRGGKREKTKTRRRRIARRGEGAMGTRTGGSVTKAAAGTRTGTGTGTGAEIGTEAGIEKGKQKSKEKGDDKDDSEKAKAKNTGKEKDK